MPPLSIANDFQIGKTPDELTDLTLPEKLLISLYRPKIYLVKLRNSAGPETQQCGLLGNTITFPQDIVKIAASLPANPDIFVDHLKVVFLGSTRPTREMLKKVLTVRRDKVFNAVRFLIDNNPLYQNVTLSDVSLPVDDVPEEILRLLHQDDDVANEAENAHSTYTPQTDLNDVPTDAIVMNTSGMIDIEGTSVSSSDQMNSAIQSLQGTLYVPHGNIPLNEYNNPNLWLGSYPWLFPYGKGGPESFRKLPVSLKAYMKHLLLLKDRKFSLDTAMKFHSFNVLQKRDVALHTSLQVVRKRDFHSTATRIDSVTNEDLQQVVRCVENRTPVTAPNVKKLMDSISSVGAHINGSPYEKSRNRREIFGLMVKYGTPTLWITISPAGSHSPIFLRLADHDVNLLQVPSHTERAKLFANDPVAAASYYDTVLNAFCEYLLGYNQPNGGIFGHVSAYYGMTEEQGTGTLHNHMLVWLYNFKSASKLKIMLEDDEFKANLKRYLERIIKQEYIGTDSVDEDLNVSDVSCKDPINPADYVDDPSGFEEKLYEDVNHLVKVANTHKCRSTCYKYRKNQVCRFGYPRDIVPETQITDDNIILLKRLSQMINNYNPYIMTCIRSNHDIKFVPSGKDGYNIAFYVSEYQTKAQISTHQIVPLISASKKQVDVTYNNENCSVRTKMLINKCLNRILTETEISASHVSYFLLGNSDKKTSHSFVRLNLHNAIGWLASEIREYQHRSDEAIPSTESTDDIRDMLHTMIDDIVDTNDDNNNDNDDDHDDEGNDNDEDTRADVYNISRGNTGFVLTNQITDYLHRGIELRDMCLYEYSSKVYKTTFTDDEKKKHLKDMKRLDDEKKYPNWKRKTGRKPKDAKFFSDGHPQSKTHWQIVRKGDGFVPSLSKLPSNPNSNKVMYQKCMLLLFKPFCCFTDLYDGNSWNDSYETCDFAEMTNYIDNIQEMHIGLEEREQNRDNENEDESNADTVDSSDDELNDDNPIIPIEVELDAQTNSALDTIRSTGWLQESASTHQTTGPIFTNDCPLPPSKIWVDHLDKQKEDMLNDIQGNDNAEIEDHIPTPEELLAMHSDNSVSYSVETCNDRDPSDIATEIMDRYQLNRKQRVAFKTAVTNVIKRENNEQTDQIIAYIGGPGGTGKSQIIKAIVAFHVELKAKNKIRMTACTGTAAKHIGGSTVASLFNFGRTGNG